MGPGRSSWEVTQVPAGAEEEEGRNAAEGGRAPSSFALDVGVLFPVYRKLG